MSTAGQRRRQRRTAGDDEAAPPEFAALPHGIASDARLKPVERLAVAGLLYWACDRSKCMVSNEKLGAYLGVCERVVIRSLRTLEGLGYIRCRTVRPTRGNMTGRVIHLAWRKHPSLIPDPPNRESHRDKSHHEEGDDESTSGHAKGMTLESYPRAGGADSKVIPLEGGGSDSGVIPGMTPESGRVCLPRHTGYDSHVIPGMTLESPKEELRRIENTTPPSSSSKTVETDDDDDGNVDLNFDWEKPVGKRHAIEAARVCFGDAVAALVEGDADRIAEEIGGRWDAYTGAIFLAKTVKGGVTRHLPYFRSASGRLIVSGITAEAKAAREQFLEGRRGLAEYFARFRAESEARESAALEVEQALRDEARSIVASLSARGVGMRLEGEGTVRLVDAQGEAYTRAPEVVRYDERESLQRLKPQIMELLKERDGLAVEAEVAHA